MHSVRGYCIGSGAMGETQFRGREDGSHFSSRQYRVKLQFVYYILLSSARVWRVSAEGISCNRNSQNRISLLNVWIVSSSVGLSSAGHFAVLALVRRSRISTLRLGESRVSTGAAVADPAVHTRDWYQVSSSHCRKACQAVSNPLL